ncbi:MAG TPA: MOP flippase family protein [Longimicrobiaceae bacterium]|nr:MOP flippase family protein [Longimicrobiaceae bacterium]
MSLRRAAAAGFTWTGLSSVGTTLVQFAQLAMLARLLAPDDFGLLAMVMVVLGFAQAFTDMGVSQAIVHRQDATRDQLSSLYWLNVLAGVAVFVIVAAAAPLLARLFGDDRLRAPVMVAACVFLITPWGQQFQVLLERELRFRTLTAAEVSASVLGALVAVTAAWQGRGVFALVYGQLAGSAVRAGILCSVGWREWRPGLRFRWADVTGFVGFGVYQMLERCVNFASANVDKLLIGSLLGAGPLGFYNVAYQMMVRPFQVFNPVVTRVAFPVFARVQNDLPRLRAGYLEVLRVIALVIFPVYLGMAALAGPLFTTLMGDRWQPAVPIFQVLVTLGIIWSLGNPIGSLLWARGRADLGLYMNLVAVATYAAAITVGARWGVMGVAVAMCAGAALVLFPLEFLVRWRIARFRPLEYLASFLPALAAAVLMGAAVHGVSLAVARFGRGAQLGAGTVAGVAVYAALALWWQRPFLLRLREMVRGRRGVVPGAPGAFIGADPNASSVPA